MARLRNRRFTSLGAANAEIAGLVDWVNDRPFKKLPGSRRSVPAALDQPALRPLPANAYEFATWRRAKVNIDYHIEVRADRHYYSVPYRLVGETVEVRISQRNIEIFSNHRRVASHVRRYTPGFSTDPAHMPESHRRHAEWTPGRIVAWAERTGPAVAKLAAEILAERPHPEQGYRTCLGIIRLGDRYGPERLARLCPGARDPCPQLPIGRVHPAQRARHQAAASGRSGASPPGPRKRPGTGLLPMKGTCMLNHQTIEGLHALRLPAMAAGLQEQAGSADYQTLSFDGPRASSTENSPSGRTGAGSAT
jgi:hypothetical protein